MLYTSKYSLELGGHVRYSLEEVLHQAIVRHLEDGRLLVLVDGHDGLGVLHARQMLDSARDAHLRGYGSSDSDSKVS